MFAKKRWPCATPDRISSWCSVCWAGELTRLGDTMLLFEDRRVMLAVDAKTKLAELLNHYVARNFTTRAHQSPGTKFL